MTYNKTIGRTRLPLVISLCSVLAGSVVLRPAAFSKSKGCELINTDKQNMAMHTHKNLRNVG